MPNSKIFTITPVILVEQSSKQRNSISHSLNIVAKKIKYKYPSLKKIDYCFDKTPLNFPPIYTKLLNNNLDINKEQPICRYKRILPPFKLMNKDKDHSVINIPMRMRHFCDSLIKQSFREEEGSNLLFDIKKKITNVSKLVKVKNINSIFSDSIYNKKLISLTRNLCNTNKSTFQSLSTRYQKMPKYSCVYIKQKLPSFDLSELIHLRGNHSIH